MDRIADRIRKLRLEIEQALNETGPLPTGVWLEADRVIVTLPLAENGPHTPASQSVDRENLSTSPATLTIEFQVRKPQNSQSLPQRIESKPKVHKLAPDELRAAILETATVAFGSGGFDNSARAEVFCELVEGLSENDLVTALNVVATGSADLPQGPLCYPISRLRQILSFAPQGSEIAATRLLEILAQTSVRELVTILAKEWSFGTHWPQASKE